jgi:lipid-binding SYLF domain-containing protein
MTRTCFLRSILLATLLGAGILPLGAARAATEQQEVVENAKFTVESMLGNDKLRDLRSLMSRARAVLVFPNLLKAGFILGGEGGTGVLLVRGDDGTWSPPAFYRLWSGSFGLQAGVQNSEVIFTIMTQKGIDAVLDRQVKLGADASVAVGPHGAGTEAATGVALDADMYSYSQASGVYAGVSFEGSFLEARTEWNKRFYAREVHSRDIVIGRKVMNESAVPLMRALERR